MSPPSSHFVESSGAVLFSLPSTTSPTLRVCLLHYLKNNEWLLAKGRRNIGEHRSDAAIREVTEETGYTCRLYPITMDTRAPPSNSAIDMKDEVRVVEGLTESFMVTTREVEDGIMKIIWWYVAVLDENEMVEKGPGEKDFEAEFWSCEEAVGKLTFPDDREVLRRAILLVEGVQGLNNMNGHR